MAKIRNLFSKKILTFGFLALLGLGFTGCGGTPGNTVFYLALGDSLSVGVQPNLTTGQNMETDNGYPDVLFQLLLAQFPNLELVKLGCSGETTVTMADGGICDYPQGSQLDAAKDFIMEHKDQIALITIDIGVNDLLTSGCIDFGPPLDVDAACVEDFLMNVLPSRLTFIMNELFQQVAGTDIPIIGLNYYNPFVVIYFQVYPLVAAAIADQVIPVATPGCQEFCTATCMPLPDCIAPCTEACVEQAVSEAILENAPEETVNQITGVDDLAMAFNFQVLKGVYDLVMFPVADVFDAFMSADFTLVPAPAQFLPIEEAPINALKACQLTYMCAPAPVGPNIHATDAGYDVMGQTVFDLFNSL